MKVFHVYILANKKYGALYTGVTSNITKRVWMHKKRMIPGFTKRYDIHKLVYYEKHDNALCAIHREKCIKKWYRSWKIELIEGFNPGWKDLFCELISTGSPLTRG